MQHVERSKLYTDVIYRVKFVAALVGFTKEDQALVAELAPKIEPLLPAFIDAVYTQMFQFDILAESFFNRMQGFDGQVVYKLENLSINSEQITFRRSMLLKYFVRSMRSMSDFESLIPYLDWVAAVRLSIHSKQSFIPIEFIHCNGLLGFMSGELIKLVAQLHLPHHKMTKAQAAFTRMLWVQVCGCPLTILAALIAQRSLPHLHSHH
ncbi:Protoglobin-domain-containing protein [Catenaria anguillulae PL171]|uniref:Protoglobin-domain-containing protein n=1 Tax=Catenaria anguillulae PL171 TaxID=765915 RepID=A0A1Y2HAT9_9FUNG|nr:Protoglobin-domain-containing protein [Catenaria anguillulae PL171]